MSVNVQRRDRILVISMQRPEKRNAVNRELAVGISAALDTLDDDDELWVGVLTGTADVFCAGTDLRYGGDAKTERGGEYGLIRRRRRKPLIAAVEGRCLRRRFRDRVGLRPDRRVHDGAVRAARVAARADPVVRRHVPRDPRASRARRQAIDDHRCRAVGGAGARTRRRQRSHRAGGALDAAIAPGRGRLSVVAGRGAGHPRRYRRAVRRRGRRGWTATDRAVAAVMASSDLQEGIGAFFERRPPQWTGR